MAKRKQPKPIRYARYALEALGAYIFYGLFKLLPVDRASALGGWIGRKIGIRLGITRRAQRNLARALPELSEEEQQIVILEMWDNLGRILGEYPHLAKIWTVEQGQRVEIINADIFHQLQKSDKPAILISAHMANWEMVSVGAKRNGLEVSLVYREPNNFFIRGLLRHIRKAASDRQIPKGKTGAKEVMQVMRDKGALGMLVDQKFNRGMAVPFFGMEAMTAPAVAQMAQKYGAQIVPVRVERLEGARFRITLLPPLTLPETGHKRQDMLHIMTEINNLFEGWIRERPAQWLWVHNRWPKEAQKQELDLAS